MLGWVLRAGLDTGIEWRDLGLVPGEGLRLQRCRNTQSLLKLFSRGYGLDVPKGGLKNLSVFGWFWTTACC